MGRYSALIIAEKYIGSVNNYQLGLWRQIAGGDGSLSRDVRQETGVLLHDRLYISTSPVSVAINELPVVRPSRQLTTLLVYLQPSRGC